MKVNRVLRVGKTQAMDANSCTGHAMLKLSAGQTVTMTCCVDTPNTVFKFGPYGATYFSGVLLCATS